MSELTNRIVSGWGETWTVTYHREDGTTTLTGGSGGNHDTYCLGRYRNVRDARAAARAGVSPNPNWSTTAKEQATHGATLISLPCRHTHKDMNGPIHRMVDQAS